MTQACLRAAAGPATAALGRALIALLVAALAFYAGSQERLPPLIGPAGNGLVVTTNAAGDLVSVDPATEASRTLVPGVITSNLCCVDVSPDGQRVAFLRIDPTTDDPSGLGVVNVDGTGLREYDAISPRSSSHSSGPRRGIGC